MTAGFSIRSNQPTIKERIHNFRKEEGINFIKANKVMSPSAMKKQNTS